VTAQTHPSVSVVIPTRNRPHSLARALAALARQESLPDEVVIVDASDSPLDEAALRRAHGPLRIALLSSAPGVCRQRNIGVRAATGSHVLLCDDDIEPPAAYLRKLLEYVHANPSAGAVTGVVSEPDASGRYVTGFPVLTLKRLFFAFVFQLSVHGDVEAVEATRLTAFPLKLIKRWYRHRGNRWSLAGWPLLTQVRSPAVPVAIYGLGAALVRRDWLLASPYDERFGAHGVGDNFGVALGFPSELPIVILTGVPVLHHRSADNRLEPADAYFQRALALDYFVRTSPRFSHLTALFLGWSLVGNAVVLALRGRRELLGRTLRALGLVASGRNPLLFAQPSRAPVLSPRRHAS
jgi:glycosyltransferase involved in cell wall biosynthesis